MPGSSDAYGVCLLPLVHEPVNNVVHLVCWTMCGYKRAVNLPKHTEDTHLVLHVFYCRCVVTRTCASFVDEPAVQVNALYYEQSKTGVRIKFD